MWVWVEENSMKVAKVDILLLLLVAAVVDGGDGDVHSLQIQHLNLYFQYFFSKINF